MKYATLLFALALIAIAGTANATEATPFSFDYNSQESYYSCSYAESQAKKVLKTMGANVLDVNCSGGIDHNMLMPLSMDGGFILEAQGTRTVVLKGRDSCDFNVKLINTILATIPTASVKAQSNCWNSEGNYRFEVTLP